jgi:hypothetical protein
MMILLSSARRMPRCAGSTGHGIALRQAGVGVRCATAGGLCEWGVGVAAAVSPRRLSLPRTRVSGESMYTLLWRSLDRASGSMSQNRETREARGRNALICNKILFLCSSGANPRILYVSPSTARHSTPPHTSATRTQQEQPKRVHKVAQSTILPLLLAPWRQRLLLCASLPLTNASPAPCAPSAMSTRSTCSSAAAASVPGECSSSSKGWSAAALLHAPWHPWVATLSS